MTKGAALRDTVTESGTKGTGISIRRVRLLMILKWEHLTFKNLLNLMLPTQHQSSVLSSQGLLVCTSCIFAESAHQ